MTAKKSKFKLSSLLLLLILPLFLIALKNPIRFDSKAAVPWPTPIGTNPYTVCPVAQSGCNYVGEAGLRAAIGAVPFGGTVLIKSGNYPITQTLLFGNSGGNLIPKSITLQGEGLTTVLNGNSTLPIMLSFRTPTTITLKSLSIKNTSSDAINFSGTATLNLSGVSISNTPKSAIFSDTATQDAATASAYLNVNNSVFYSTGTGPTLVGAITLSGGHHATVTNTVFYNNKYGVLTWMPTNRLTVKNTIFMRSSVAGISAQGANIIYTLSHNLFWGNNSNCNAYMTNLCNVNGTLWNIDPKFYSPPTSFRLLTGSPAINAGEGLDNNGSPADIGAYGGLGACTLDPLLCPRLAPRISIEPTNQ